MRRMWLLLLTALTVLLTGTFSAGATQAAAETQGSEVAAADSEALEVIAATCGLQRVEGPKIVQGSGTVAYGYLPRNTCGSNTYARVRSNSYGRTSLCYLVRANDVHLFTMPFRDTNWSVERCSSGSNTAAKPSPGNNSCVRREESAAVVPVYRFGYTVFNGCNINRNWRVYMPDHNWRSPCLIGSPYRFDWIASPYTTGNWIVENC